MTDDKTAWKDWGRLAAFMIVVVAGILWLRSCNIPEPYPW
jgi:hypothetical protein